MAQQRTSPGLAGAIRVAPSRRVALKAAAVSIAVGAAFGARRSTRARAAPTAAGPFRDFRDWAGEWEGSYDGRPARLRIDVPPSLRSTTRFYFDLTFGTAPDLWWTRLSFDTFDADAHLVRDRRLYPMFGGTPGRDELEWPLLLLHTWDTDFIAGISRWQGRDYGLFFQRRDADGPTYFGGRRFTSWYNLGGRGDAPTNTGIAWGGLPGRRDGLYDGRAASLAINVDPTGPRPREDAHVDFRFIDEAGRWWRAVKTVRPWEFWVEDLEFRPYGHAPGEGTFRWPRFHLHTWDTGQASGWSEWNGQPYGFLFRNGSPARWT